MGRVPLVVEPDVDDPGCATVFVDGAIGGRPHRFVLDTGAVTTQVVADDSLAALVSSGRGSATGVFGTLGVDVVTVPLLTVGPVTAVDVLVHRVAAGRPGAHSLLGLDVLGAHALRLDLDARHLDLLASGALPADRVLRRGRRGHCYLDVAWPGAPGLHASACWDTGAGATLVDTSLVLAHPGLFTRVGSSHGTDASGVGLEAPTYLVAQYEVGGVAFGPHQVAVVDLPQADEQMSMILGYPTLRQAVWTLDLPAARWAAAPAAPVGV